MCTGTSQSLYWYHVTLSILLLLSAGCFDVNGEGLECSDHEKPWRCNTVVLCYSDRQRCNGVNDCGDFTDESNCTSVGVTKHLIIYNNKNNQANLAWLVTPVVLAIGVLYAIYKCFKEGLCQLRRMQHAQEADGSYFALDQVAFFSMTPLQRSTLASPGHQLMVVHNHHFSLTMSEPLPPPPDEDQPHSHHSPPPTYAEAVNPGISNAGFAPIPQEDPDLPPYKERATPPPPITPPPAFTPRARPTSSLASPTSLSTSPQRAIATLPSPLSLHSSPLSTHSPSFPPTSPHLPPFTPIPSHFSARLPPPPSSPAGQAVSMPTLQQLSNTSTHRGDSRSNWPNWT